MIEETHGNLLTADVDALVNTVNTVGVMGKGIALQFKRAFPGNFKAYDKACADGKVDLGRMFVWDAGALDVRGPRYIINFPTKKHWRSKSKLRDIEQGLDDLIRQVQRLDITSIAVPPLGCGHGGLGWAEVQPLIEKAFKSVPEVKVLLFPPAGAPEAADQPVRTEPPRMTSGRAALIGMMQRYLPFAVDITSIDIQKVMYFLQEAGEPLKLNYSKGRYGPYADNLRHVLTTVEGHFIRGTGDGSAKAQDQIQFEVLPAAHEPVLEVLAKQPATTERMNRVSELIEGFESTYGLELLATVHWAAWRGEADAKCQAAVALAQTENTVREWNRRKKYLFTSSHIATAYSRLQDLGWLDKDASSGLLAGLDTP